VLAVGERGADLSAPAEESEEGKMRREKEKGGRRGGRSSEVYGLFFLSD
jgi:hypothetical protein